MCPKRLIQLSTVGEVFLEGTCPLSRCPQTAKFPAPLLLGARRRWVRKATAFRGRSEQDRSALVSRLLFLDFENVPVERFQRDIPFPKPADTARRVPTKPKRTEHLANCAQLDQPYGATVLKLFCFCTMRFVIVSALMHPATLHFHKMHRYPATHFFEPPHFPAGILWYNILVPNRGNHAEP